MADLINKEDKLNTGRIKLNQAIKDAEDAKITSNAANATAVEAKYIANEANEKSDLTQMQLDQVTAASTVDPAVSQMKVDTEGVVHESPDARLRSDYTKVTAQLAETIEKNPNNAPFPLSIKTYDGFNRTTHPDGVYFPNRWNGYNYWMVHTPFPFDNDFWENPSIIVSNDGVSWQDVPGLTNPIDEVTEAENEAGIYLSDGMLIFVNDRLECFYRWFNKNTREERLYRQYSYDGKTWEGKEVILDNSDSSTGLNMVLSPTMVYENEKYRMWVVDNPNRRVMHAESIDGKSWGTFTEIPLQFDGRVPEPWHIHVYKESENLYHLTFSEYTSTGGRSIFWGTSTDGKSFSNIREILKTRRDEATWDNGYLYKPWLVKVGDIYKLYYSARTVGGKGNWRIGLVEGRSMEALRPVTNYDADFYNQIPRMRSEYIRTDSMRVDGNIWIETPREGTPNIKFLRRDYAGVSLEVSKMNTIRVVRDDGTTEGDLEVRKIVLGGIEMFVADDSVHFSTPQGYRGLTASTIKTTSLDSMKASLPIIIRPEKGIKFLQTGKYGASIEVVATDTLEVKRDSGHSGASLKVGNIIFDGTRNDVEGSIRYNNATKKHQGYDGTTWHDLY